jgi:protein-disulfide isomerase
MTQKKSKQPAFSTTAALVALLPVMFLAGLFVGYQVWSVPIVDVTPVAADAGSQRVEIPIYADDAVLGSSDAPVTIVEFSDYQCPYCRSYHNETFKRILAEYGDVIQYVYKDLPLEQIHPEAAPAANAAHCAGEQDAFWNYHDLLFSNQQGFGFDAYITYANALELDMPAFITCLEENRYLDTISADIQILVDLGAPISTPTFFINGQYLAGAQPFSEFARLIEAELQN